MNYTEKTLLSPTETEISLEIKVMDADNVIEPNRYGEYVLVFMPLCHTEEQRFHEMAEKAMMDVERRKAQYSYKEPNKKFITPRDKFFYATQLFPPKINDKNLHPDHMYNRDASIKGHFRDLPNGDIVFNIDYIDFYMVEETRQPMEVDWSQYDPTDPTWF